MPSGRASVKIEHYAMHLGTLHTAGMTALWFIVITVENFRRNIFAQRTHTHRFNGPLSRTTQVSQYQKGKTNPDFNEARDSEWQWHQPGHMQVCTSLHASTPPLSFLQAGRPSCRPTNSDKALKAHTRRKKSSAKLVTHATKPPDDFLGDQLNVSRSQCNCSVRHDLSLYRTQSTSHTPL